MKIVDVQAFPCSFPTAPEARVKMGIGEAVKRDTVVVKVTTDDGLVGWGEAHHGRAPGTIAHLINSNLKHLVVGMSATDVAGVWQRLYRMHFSSHGLGAGTAIAMSGIDMALWDVRGKAVGWPLYRLLGGAAREIPAYAGGVSLGYAEPGELIDEMRPSVEAGYRAVKVRIGDSPDRDLARVAAVRDAFGDDLVILTDANTGYSVADARAAIPGLVEHGVSWLEEPFPPHDYRSYQTASSYGPIPLAAGENHYTRFEFHRLITDGAVSILQPDLSKTGGVTEVMRIAALASAWKLSINPHTASSGLNMAATIHLLAAIDNGGYFEGDVSRGNLFRDQLVSTPYEVSAAGTVRPLEGPGLGLGVDEDFLAAHPVIDGPSYV
ncbi:MAG: mandelate racemase/muconate lactonizing enzyme family protein [Streptosporangiales bacterium]|nr:mandelate racemase/muconate lactonizing enzyme family protein [Streptosporangiales bacterium]